MIPDDETMDAASHGTVYLVGAGPGDPGLLTVRAAECLRRADLVLYDYLANPTLVEHAAPTAEKIRLGHHGSGRSLSPDEITEVMLEAARAGRTVVRLKGGDPSIFGRGADEADALRAEGIPFEIVPGITSGLAIAAYAEIPLTHHEVAPAVALVTARERCKKPTQNLDFAALAAFPGTLVLYMGVNEAPAWSGALMEHGKPADTPVAVVAWCSRARQQIVRCTLGTVTDMIRESGIRPPALFVVGEVVDRAPDISWFASRPLFGRTVLVAGTSGTASRLRDALSEAGAEVITQPVLRVADPEDWAPVNSALDRITDYDWMVLSSPNGVDRLMKRLFERGGDVRGLAGVKLAVLGEGAAARLEHFQLRPDLVPDRYRPQQLAERLVSDVPRARVLLVTGEGERPTLATELERLGAQVERVVGYRTVEVEEPDLDVACALADGEIHWLAVTSGTSGRSLARLYGDALKDVQIASLSPITTQALQDVGLVPATEAAPSTIPGLVDAIVAFRELDATAARAETSGSEARDALDGAVV